jgi:hypothetical protein
MNRLAEMAKLYAAGEKDDFVFERFKDVCSNVNSLRSLMYQARLRAGVQKSSCRTGIISCTVSAEAIKYFREKARIRGMDVMTIAAALLETIFDDDMVGAVLDDGL